MNPPYIIVINGPGGSGKDEFIKQAQLSTSRSILNISTVDPIKEAAKDLGWDGTKTEENRKFLSDLKDLCTKCFDTSFKYIATQINFARKHKTADIIFIHCREPREIDRIVNIFGARTLFVDASERVETITSNHADAETSNYTYDYVIDNNGTLDNLRGQAARLMRVIDWRLRMND